MSYYEEYYDFEHPVEPPVAEQGDDGEVTFDLAATLTAALGLREGVVLVEPDIDRAVEQITAIVGFTARLDVNALFLQDDQYQATMDVIRDATLDSMLAYLQEHDSTALINLVRDAELKAVARFVEDQRNRLFVPPSIAELYPSDRGEPRTPEDNTGPTS